MAQDMKSNVANKINIVKSMAPSVDDLARMRVQECYQCGKCTAGCPVAHRMDVMPNQIIRLTQLGQFDRAILADSIWQCVSCQTCTARCPQSVDCAGVMDVLRQLAVTSKFAVPARRQIVVFYKAFLRNIRRNGRLNELELVGDFKISVFIRHLNLPFLFKDTLLALRMMKRGKFHLTGEKVRDRGVVDRIFDRCIRNGLEVRAPAKDEKHQ